MSGQNLRIAGFLVAAALAVAVGIFAGNAWFRPAVSPDGRATGTASVGGPFRLTDQNGTARTDQDFRGKLMLIYFGYAFCPDACPTALQAMTVAVNALGKDGEAVTPIFITVDPERDTVEQLRIYAQNFHPRLVALTGTKEETAQAAKSYRVYYAKQKAETTTEYLVDHSSIIFLMGRDGRYLTHFSHGSPPSAIAAELRKRLAGGGGV
jgi:protein SCO1/2